MNLTVVTYKNKNNGAANLIHLAYNLCTCPTDKESELWKNELKKPVLAEMTKKIEEDNSIFGTNINDIVTLDGLRIIFPDGFALIRQSNTEPVFTLRFEAKTEKNAVHYKNTMVSLLDEIIAQLSE